jgi:hypothetical protein
MFFDLLFAKSHGAHGIGFVDVALRVKQRKIRVRLGKLIVAGVLNLCNGLRLRIGFILLLAARLHFGVSHALQPFLRVLRIGQALFGLEARVGLLRQSACCGRTGQRFLEPKTVALRFLPQ